MCAKTFVLETATIFTHNKKKKNTFPLPLFKLRENILISANAS